MRVPQKSTIHQAAPHIVVFILGVLCGAIIFLYIHGQIMDDIMLENRHLTSENKKLTEEIEALEENMDALEQPQIATVKKLEIKVLEQENGLDGFTEQEAVDLLREQLKFLINMPVQSVAETHAALQGLIHSQNYTINQQEIDVHFQSMIIYTTITIHISLHKIA